MNKDWKGDEYAAPHYEALGERYMTLNDGILDSLEEEYKDRGEKMVVHSSRVKKECPV